MSPPEAEYRFVRELIVAEECHRRKRQDRILYEDGLDRERLVTHLTEEAYGEHARADRSTREWLLTTLSAFVGSSTRADKTIQRFLDPLWEPDPGVRFAVLVSLRALPWGTIEAYVGCAVGDPHPLVSSVARALRYQHTCEADDLQYLRDALGGNPASQLGALRATGALALSELAEDVRALGALDSERLREAADQALEAIENQADLHDPTFQAPQTIEPVAKAPTDRRLEKLVRGDGFEDLLEWTEKLLRRARSMCRIRFQNTKGELTGGTGFLVYRDLVLTAYHVLEDVHRGEVPASQVKLTFGFLETGEGPVSSQQSGLARASKWLVAHSRYSDCDKHVSDRQPRPDELDFALVRLDTSVGGDDEDAWIPLAGARGPRRGDDIVSVLQHPELQALKRSSGCLRPQRSAVRLRYDADTMDGSSGGLVLNQRLDPVAIHQSGDPEWRPAKYNQGIPLLRVREALESDPNVDRFW